MYRVIPLINKQHSRTAVFAFCYLKWKYRAFCVRCLSSHARTHARLRVRACGCVIRQGILFEIDSKNSSVEIVLLINRMQSKLYKYSNTATHLA